MKAYKVYDSKCYEGYEEIIFANNAREAKMKGYRTSELLCDSNWIDIRVN